MTAVPAVAVGNGSIDLAAGVEGWPEPGRFA